VLKRWSMSLVDHSHIGYACMMECGVHEIASCHYSSAKQNLTVVS